MALHGGTATVAWSHKSLVRRCADGFVVCQASHTEGLIVYAFALKYGINLEQHSGGSMACLRQRWKGICVCSPAGRASLGRSHAFVVLVLVKGLLLTVRLAGVRWELLAGRLADCWFGCLPSD